MVEAADMTTKENDEIARLTCNLEIARKQYSDLVDSLPETHWAYWRKRSGEMTDKWREVCDELEKEKARSAELVKAAKLVLRSENCLDLGVGNIADETKWLLDLEALAKSLVAFNTNPERK